MSSHRDWEVEIQQEHDEKKPFAPENGEELKFKIGDTVSYTNSNGVIFDGKTVTGFHTEKDSLYHAGKRYYIDTDCHWMPVKESSLSSEKSQ